jgi:methionyl-tRNA synthetase
MLQDWLAGRLTDGAPVVHPSVAAKLKEWLDAEGGVRDWDISRDAPYFGFPIPDAPGKFFYVWLDAPIGYLASFKKLCAGVPVVRATRPVERYMRLDAAKVSSSVAAKDLDAASFDQFMQVTDAKFDASAEMHHFLGKDIVNFHGLFWPAMLKGAGLRTPDALHVNGYLTVNGEKMSKSRGTFVMARTYLDAKLDADHLRYYFATMLTAAPIDLDLDLKAFEERVNSHLVGKWVNLASRCAGFVHKIFDGHLADSLPATERAAYDASAAKLAACTEMYRTCDYAGVVRALVEVADEANAYVATKAPWLLAKDESKREELHVVCTLALNWFRLLSIWLSPVVPGIAARARMFLAEDWSHFDAARAPVLGTRIAEFSTLTTRIDPKKIETMIEASKESLKPSDSAPAVAGAASAAIPTGEASKQSIAASAAPTGSTRDTGPVTGTSAICRAARRRGTVHSCPCPTAPVAPPASRSQKQRRSSGSRRRRRGRTASCIGRRTSRAPRAPRNRARSLPAPRSGACSPPTASRRPNGRRSAIRRGCRRRRRRPRLRAR